MTFGDRLKSLRDVRQLSQVELAERSGVHRMTIAKIEQGQRSDPGWSVVTRLADGLDVTPDAFTQDGFEKILKKSAKMLDALTRLGYK